MVVIPKKDGNVRITVNYEKFTPSAPLVNPPSPRVDEVLDPLGIGRIFSLLGIVPSFHQPTIDKDTITLMASPTPTRLVEWYVMPEGRSAAPGWFAKVINEVIKDLDRVAACLGDVIVFDLDPRGTRRQCPLSL